MQAYERTARVTGGLRSGRPDPAGAVHLTVGCGGNAEGLYTLFDPRGVGQYPWMAGGYREAAYGYGELAILNATHADWRWHKLVERFGSLTGGSEVADQARLTHPPRAAALLASAAAVAAGIAPPRVPPRLKSCCAAEMADCEGAAGCHAVWACMGSSTTTAAAGSVFGELCGDDAACAQVTPPGCSAFYPSIFRHSQHACRSICASFHPVLRTFVGCRTRGGRSALVSGIRRAGFSARRWRCARRPAWARRHLGQQLRLPATMCWIDQLGGQGLGRVTR